MGMIALAASGFLIVGAVSQTFSAAPALDPPAAMAPESKAAHLNELFAELKAAADVAASRAIEDEIWTEWLKSGDAETDAMMTMAITAMSTGVLNQALALLDKIVARSPDYAEGWNKRATLYYEIDDYDKSLADIEETLKREPRHFGALSGLGMIMIKLGDKRRALAAFEKAVEVDPMINNGTAIIEQLKAAISKDI
jgi:tetratricopeptide (TPR) repeat protein